MSIDNLKTVIYGTTLVLVSIGLLYLVSKYYFNRLLAGLEPCEISVLNLGNHNEAIYVVDLGVHFNTRVFLSRTHQTKSYWLPFFAFVTEWDPEKMGVNLVSQVLRKKTKGKKLILIYGMKGPLNFYTQKEPA